MFKYPRHEAIHNALQKMDATLLRQNECYFGGGTAIVMALSEYRESSDIDFLCASKEGYRFIRNLVRESGLDPLFHGGVKAVREIKVDMYGIRTFIELDGRPVKFEIVNEGRIPLCESEPKSLIVPTLAQSCMYAEKLLANDDRGLDCSYYSRDLIDLGMMIKEWGPVPVDAWHNAENAYGDDVKKHLVKCAEMFSDPDYARICFSKMHMGMDLMAPLQLEIAEEVRRAQETKTPRP